MSKKHKQNHFSNYEKKDLAYYMDNFDEYCEKCGLKLVVHAHRQKSKTKRMAVYASCTNKGRCGRFGLEICFIEKF